MKNKLFITTLLISVLGGCHMFDTKSIYHVDFEHLVRSAFYTQQELLKLELGNSSEQNSERYQLLMISYCDLIDRGYIVTSEKPQSCGLLADATDNQHEKTDQDYCAAAFHRCFNSCSLRNDECTTCEEQIMICLH